MEIDFRVEIIPQCEQGKARDQAAASFTTQIATRIKQVVIQDSIDEGHLRLISSLLLESYFFDWLKTYVHQESLTEGHLLEILPLCIDTHFQMDCEIKGFITQGFLEETHLREMLSLQLELYFFDWLTTEHLLKIIP